MSRYDSPAHKRNTTRRDRLRARIARGRPNCHICGEPINYDAPRDDPRSFALDHVIPLARGGADDHTNVAASHRACNSKKRARIVAPIVRRSGSLG